MTALKIEALSASAENTVSLETLVGQSEWMAELRSIIQAVAPYPSSVLITGPSGTGKELIARAIHHLSPRGMPIHSRRLRVDLRAAFRQPHVRAFERLVHRREL